MDDLDAAIDGLSQPAPEAGDPIGAAVDDVIRMDKARTGGAIRSAITVNPDQAAKAKAISLRAGLPQDLVMRNLPEMEAKDTAARIEAVSERSNVLSSMFRDRPDFGQLAHDDVDNLSAIERIYQDRAKRASQPIDVFRTGRAYAGAATEGIVGQTAGGTLTGLSEGFDIAARGLRGLVAPMLPAGVLEFMDRTTMPEWMDPKQQFLKKPGEALKNLGRLAGPDQADTSFGTDVAKGIGQVGGQIAAALLTGGASSAVMLAAQGVDQMTEKVAQDEATQAEKDVAVLLGAGWTAVTEKYGLDKLLNRVPPAVKNAALRKIADIAAGAGIEAAQEMAEGIGQDVIRRVFTDPDAQIGQGVLNEGSVAGAVGAIVRAALGVRTRGAQVQQAKDDAASMEALDKLAQESKVRKRSQADWQSFMQEVAKDGPVKDVYIDARDLDESALRKLVEASPAAAQQAAESLASGVDMQIPSAEFGANVFGQGFAQSIIPHLKTDPNGMSLTQADAAGKTEKQDQERIVTDTLARAGEEDAIAKSRAAVEARVLEQSIATGRLTPDAHKPYAALTAARYAAMASRLGITPEQAFERYPLTVAAETPTGPALEQGDILDLGDLSSMMGEPTTQNNASGESAASLEAQSRLAEEKARDRGRYVLDVRTGAVRPLVGVDAVDTSAQAGQVIVQKNVGANTWTVLSAGRDVTRNAALAAVGRGQASGALAQQVDQTETPEFKRWFGDSKVVDANGKPLVVYHSSPVEDAKQLAENIANGDSRAGAMGHLGMFLSRTPEIQFAYSSTSSTPHEFYVRGNLFTPSEENTVDVANEFLASVQGREMLGYDPEENAEEYDALVKKVSSEIDSGQLVEINEILENEHFVEWLRDVKKFDGVDSGVNLLVFYPSEQLMFATGARGQNDPSILNQGQQPVGASGPQQPAVRGTYTPEAKTIALLKDANFSTFVHESGHLYLDQTAQIAAEADAPAEIKADMQTLLDWFGIKAEEGASALEVWNRMTVDQQREHHEKFARGFEAFAWEGKAPSVALSGAFQRFRGWLRNLYRSLTSLNVQLTDEVRAVMARMVATDEEIAQAKAAQSMGMMFDQAAAEKLGIDYRAYQELDRDSTDEAASELDQRRLGDLKWYENAKSAALRERQREVADIRRQVKAEARTIVMSRPVYRAWAFLTGKSGQAVVPGVTDVSGADETAMVGKLRTSAIADSMGDASDAPWRKLIALRMTNDTTGMHPDIVAEMFGYASGQELVTDLVNSPTPSVSIEAQTDSLMLERYGDITSQEALERAAVEAVYNKARTRVIATELTALEKAAKVTKKTVNDAARAFAAQVVGRQKVGDLRPEKFEAAARKAGQASLKAFKAGDIQKAATEKRNELINTYAARAAREAKAEIDKKVKLYTKAANKSIIEVAKTRDADTVQAMRAILAEYGIGTKGEPAQKYIDALKSHDPDTHARLAESIEALTANAQPYTSISVDDFRVLADNIDAMWQLARRSRQMEIDGDLIDAQEAQEAITAAIEAEGVPARIAGEGRAVTEGEKTTAILRSARAALRRVESWVYARDGGPQGAFRKFVFNPIKTGADNYRAAQAQYRKRYLDLLSKLDLKSGRIDAPELGYVFGYSKGGSGKQEILHAILHTGNDSNKRKLLLGRKWADLNEDETIDTSRWDAFVKRMVDQGVITKTDYDFAQGVWDLLEETKAGAQQTHRQVFGRSFDEVTANSFTTPFGAYRGGYVPAMADHDAVSDAKTRAILEEENQTMAHAFPSTAKGFTKGRVEYNKPLLLDLRSLGGHLDKVLMFTHLESAVRDVRRLLGNSKVREPLSRMDLSAYDGMLIPWLNRAARQQSEAPVPAYNGLMKWLSKARSRAGMASMIGNVVNSVQQVTGFAVAALRVKPRYLRSALVEYVKNPRKAAEAVASASPYMESRMRNEVAQMNLAIDEILLNPNVYQRAQAWTARHGYFMQSAVDNVMGPIIWTGAYNEAIEQGASELDARRQADSAIRETQGSTLPEDISQFEAGNAFTRLFTQFQGYFNMQANLLGTEFAKVQREIGLRAGMGRGLYVFTLGFLAPAVVGALIAEAGKGGPDDEDGDGYLDDWLAALGIGTAKSAFAMVPGAGQVGVLVFNAANNKPYDDKASLSPAVSMVEAAARSPFSAYSAIAGEGSARKAVRDVGSLIQLTTGLPGGAVARPLGYAAGLATGEIEPTGPADMARGLITGNPSPESKR